MAWGGAPVVRVDDFLYWGDLRGWWPRPEHQALRPLLAGTPCSVTVDDFAGSAPGKGARVDQLSLGVISRSRKENERRLAIHPLHVERIDAGLRERVYLERGYGERFGVPDEQLASCVAGLRSREELLAECDVILLPKPQPQDLAQMRDGQVLWGWPHCVQDGEITQLSIERRLTLIAFEAMNYWNADGSFGLHVFHKNNELAGYCSVLHALELIGTTGEYGRRLRAAVISFGATGRGAVTALNAHGVNDVDVLTHRDINAVASPIHSARMVHFERTPAIPAAVMCCAGPAGYRWRRSSPGTT